MNQLSEWAGWVPTYGPPEPIVNPLSPDEHHWLVMERDGDEVAPYVEHPADCAVRPSDEPCIVQLHIDAVGFDNLEPLPDVVGRWRIEPWYETYPGGPWGPTEYDAGLRYSA